MYAGYTCRVGYVCICRAERSDGKLHKINDIIKVNSVDDQLQKIETDTCGIFQLYFYFNLFVPFENSLIIKDTKLSKKTIEKLLNEIFSLNRD